MKLFAAVALVAGTLATVATLAADDPKQREDLTAVIALQGKPCGQVVSYTVQGESDFLAVCKDGNRYRVYVKDGRVTVEKK